MVPRKEGSHSSQFFSYPVIPDWGGQRKQGLQRVLTSSCRDRLAELEGLPLWVDLPDGELILLSPHATPWPQDLVDMSSSWAVPSPAPRRLKGVVMGYMLPSLSCCDFSSSNH